MTTSFHQLRAAALRLPPLPELLALLCTAVKGCV